MHFLFSTGSLYSYSIERCFDLAARAGFDGIELMVDDRWDTRQPDYLHRLMARYGLPILAVHSPFASTVAGWPKDDVGRIKLAAALAEAVGARVVVHHLPLRLGYVVVSVTRKGQFFLPVPGWDMDQDYRRWLIGDYARFQAGLNVLLCIENMPARRVLGRQINAHSWNTAEAIARFPALTLDTTHLGTWSLEPADVYPRLDGRVRHIHLSNFDGREHRRPETGKLALDRLLALLAAGGYNGAVTLELHPDALDAGQDDSQVVALLTNSLTWCRQKASAGQ